MFTSLKSKLTISVVTGVLIVLGFLSKALGGQLTSSGFFLVAAVLAGVPTALSALRALKVRAFSIDLLVSIAVTGALVIKEFEEAAIVAFLFIFGAFLEARTLAKTRKSLKDLVDLAPQEAEVYRDGELRTIDVDEVVEDDRVVLRTGSRVPVDGHIVKGGGTINEAAITGEPLAVAKDLHSPVWSGSVVESGYLEMVAERVGQDTTFNQIIELVEQAQDSKAPVQKFLDKFAAIYTPAIIVAAVLAGIVTRDVAFALTFLVIACPGALVISTPVSLVAGLGNASRHGALIKGGDALERFAKIDTLVVDKTGTVTRGKPEVTEIVTFGGFSREEILSFAGTLEKASEHPLGQTIVEAAKAAGVKLGEVPEEVEVRKGEGIAGEVDGTSIMVGSARFVGGLTDSANQQAETLEKQGNTVSFVTVDSRLAGLIGIADEIRPEVPEAVKALRKTGIKKVVMLTGDNPHTAQVIASEAGIDQVEAGLLPVQKVQKLRELKGSGHNVAMIGDGVNDAPAIATADLGIAMGGGTDVALQSADVVLVGNRFDQLLQARATAKRTLLNMRENTVIALGTVAFLIAAVLFHRVGMGGGMLIHQASVVLVILNAATLIRFRNRDAARIAAKHDALAHPEGNSESCRKPVLSHSAGSANHDLGDPRNPV